MPDAEPQDPGVAAPVPAEPPPEPATPPGLGLAEGSALVVLFVAVTIVPTLLSALLQKATGHPIPRGWQVLLGELLAGAVLIPIGLRWSGQRFQDACPMPHYPTRLLPGIVVGSVGLAIVLAELESWLPGVQQFGELIRRVLTSSGMLPAILAAWLAAPVVEELLCRGVMLRGLHVRRSAGAAILLSATLFAVMHLNPWQGFVALPLGLAYGWLSLRTGSVLPSMLAHALHNATASLFVMPVLHKLSQGGRLAHMPPTIIAAGAVAAAAGCGLLWWQLRSVIPEGEEVSPPPAPTVASGPLRLLGSVGAMLVLFLLGVAASIWTGRGTTRDRRPSYAATRALTGCYRLQLSGDIAARLFPGAASPVDVRLTMKRRAASNGHVVERLDTINPSSADAAIYWVPRLGGEFRLIAPEKGAVLMLRRQGSDLAGEVRTYRDGAGEARIAGMARARRIACPGDSARQ